MFGDPSRIDPTFESRAVTFENPTGGREAGGSAADGRKGAPSPRVRVVNASTRSMLLDHQLDVTLGPVEPDAGMLHVSFRRENPTMLRRDFPIADGLVGPGRFLGCAVSVRTIGMHLFLAGEGTLG